MSAVAFQGLGFVDPGCRQSEANAVSADGQVVCGTAMICGQYSHVEPFRWTADSGMTALGVLPGAPSSPTTFGLGMSGDGNVIVGQGQGPNGPEAFRWTQDGGMVGLGYLQGGADSFARDASVDGRVIVGYAASSEGVRATRWTAEEGLVSIGELPGGDASSWARAISGDGSTIVGSTSSSDAPYGEAFAWTAELGMRGISSFAGGDHMQIAYDVSEDGSVIVGYGSSGNGAAEAQLWTEELGVVGLGRLDNEGRSYARGVSADGSVVVGHSGYGGTRGEPFIWTQESGMLALRDILATNGVDVGGWKLAHATAVSADGRTIVGDGWNPEGRHEAWLAVIPEPGSAALLILAVMLLRRRI